MSKDSNLLQGTWRVTSLEIDGNTLSSHTYGASQITVAGNTFTTVSMGSEYGGTFEVDETTSPKTIDMTFAYGPEKGNTALGIYELVGESWRLCLTLTAKMRPSTFATSPGSGLALETLARVTADSKSESPEHPNEFAGERVPELEGEWALVSGVRDGMPMEPMLVKSGRRKSVGGELVVTFGGQVFIKARYRVNTSRRPHEIDYYHTGGMMAGTQQLGIYELDGKRMKVIFAAPGASRPSDFSTRAGDGRTLTEWKKL